MIFRYRTWNRKLLHTKVSIFMDQKNWVSTFGLTDFLQIRGNHIISSCIWKVQERFLVKPRFWVHKAPQKNVFSLRSRALVNIIKYLRVRSLNFILKTTVTKSKYLFRNIEHVSKKLQLHQMLKMSCICSYA